MPMLEVDTHFIRVYENPTSSPYDFTEKPRAVALGFRAGRGLDRSEIDVPGLIVVVALGFGVTPLFANGAELASDLPSLGVGR